jgi:Predicted Zn-dependent peptidases
MLRKLFFVLTAYLICFLFYPAAHAQNMPDDPAVTIGKLPNGLTYYIRKNAEPKNRAVLYLALKAGSLMETDAQQGLAHFVEHMAFNGTKDFPKNELLNYLQKAGISFGADLNAYTNFDQTVYQLPIPTDSAALFRDGFKILANWAGYVTMEGSEIDSERGVIVEEERQRGKNAQSRMQQQLLPVLLKGTRHAERVPIGKIDIIKNFKHEELRQFYRDWYRPNLMAVIAVGDFDATQVEQWIREQFGALKNPVRPKPAVKYNLPDIKEPVFKLVTDAEYPHHLATVIMRNKGFVSKTVAHARINIINSMINHMMANRINALIESGKASFMQGRISYGEYEGGLFPGVDATTVVALSKSAEELPAALKGMMAELERMAQFGFTKPELEITKKNMDGGNEKGHREQDRTIHQVYVNKYVKHFMDGTAIPSDEYSYQLIKKLLSEITLEEVNNRARQMINRENLTMIVQGPEKSKDQLPGRDQLLSVVRNSGKGLTAWEDHTEVKPLLPGKPKPGKVIGEEKIEAIGVTKLRLLNGVNVYLKPTDFNNDRVLFFSFARGGTSLAEDNSMVSIAYASNIPANGIGELDNNQLRKLFAGSTASASTYLTDMYEGFRGSASLNDLETALQIVYAYATQPRKDSAAFHRHMADFKVSLTDKALLPDAVFRDTVNAVLTNYSPRHRPLTVERLPGVSLDSSYDFYKRLFADAGGQTFVFVGSFKIDSIKPLLETYLGALPSSGQGSQYINRWVKPMGGQVERIVRKGIEDKASVQLFFHGAYDFNTTTNMELHGLNKILELKVRERLREKEGGVYSPGVGLSIQKYPEPYYTFTVSFNCATANVDKLVAAVLEEVEQIKKEGALESDLDKFKAEYRRSLEVNLRTNEYWVNYLSEKLRDDEDLLSILTVDERLNALKPETIRKAATRYLGGGNYFKAVLIPEKQ